MSPVDVSGASCGEPLLIFPHNGNGVEALDCLGNAYQLLAYIDDEPEHQGLDRHGHQVVGRGGLERWPEAKVLAVPGSSTSYRVRRQIIDSLGVNLTRFARVIHPSARVSPLATIGYNVLIMAGVVITSDSVVGDHVCILPNTVIHHDACIGSWTLVGGNVTIAGDTVIGENCYIGAGSSIRNGLHMGDGSLLGIGSNLVRDMPAGSKWIGNPARLLASRVLPSLPPRAGHGV